MAWRSWWHGMPPWLRHGGWGGWRSWPPLWGDYDTWLDFHLRAAVWQIRGLAQFVRENASKLDPQTKEALARDLEELLRLLK